MYTLKYENYNETVFDKSTTLKAQMESDRKKRNEAQSIIQCYSMNCDAEGDAYEQSRSKLEEAKKKDREEVRQQTRHAYHWSTNFCGRINRSQQ